MQMKGIKRIRFPFHCCAAVPLLIVLLLLPFFPVAGALGQQTREANYAKPVFEKYASGLEDRIASDLEKRREAAANDLPGINAQVDLRLIERWLARMAADAGQGDVLQIAASIRICELEALGAALTERLQSHPNLSATQLEGLKQLHAITFQF